jgi:hypothetical protein
MPVAALFKPDKRQMLRLCDPGERPFGGSRPAGDVRIPLINLAEGLHPVRLVRDGDISL